MKKSVRIATLFLALFMALSLLFGISFAAEADEGPTLTDTSKIFDDVIATKWYKQAVDYAYTFNLFQGTSDTKFEPDAPMNRAMFVTVLARLDGAVTTNNVFTKFTDVPANKWYTGNVKWATDNKIVNGVTENTFEPMASITREQMCTMLVRYANYKGIALNAKVDRVTFADDAKIKTYAKESVYLCQTAGLVNGMTATTFEPAGTATRAQVAKILMGFHRDYIYEEVVIPPIDDGEETPVVPPVDGGEETPVVPPVDDDDNVSNMELIVNKTGKENTHWLPSFDIDSTEFVRAGTRLADLKYKTISFFTSCNYSTWSYRNSTGETIDEWTWFKNLKDELGLQVKYTVRQNEMSINSALQFMNAGKACDIIYGNQVVYPHVLSISRDITSFINTDEETPGISKPAMDLLKWGNTYRVIAPIGSVDVLWYNETMTKDLGLDDPHTLWENGEWNWNTFKQYMLSAPDTVNGGQKLTALAQWSTRAATIWPSTNGHHLFYVDNTAKMPTIINNWDNPLTMEAWEFITTVCNSVNYGSSSEITAGIQPENMGLYEGTTLMSASMYPITYRNTEYSKHIKINWVPYPKSTNETGKEVCQFSGFGMMLPKKTRDEGNIPYVLKFMELWAARFSESIFDNLSVFEYHQFSYEERVEFYNYTMTNLSFALPMNNFSGSDISTATNFFKCFTGNSSYNVRTEASKASQLVSFYIIEAMRFGQ